MATPNLPPNLGRKLSNVVAPPSAAANAAAAAAASQVPVASAAASQVPVAVVNASVNANPAASAAAAVPAAVVAPNANSNAAASAASAAAASAASAAASQVPVAAASQLKNDVSKMDIDKKIKYLLKDGEDITNDAFTKVKNNASLKIDEKLKLETYTTILQIQEAEQKMKEEIQKLEEEIETAPKTSLDPKNGPKLKGAISLNLNLLKKSKERLQPVLDVLKLKMKASNTLSTLAPLENTYKNLNEKKGQNDPEVKRHKVIFYTAIRQYAQEIKDVVQIDSNILDPKTGELIKDETTGELKTEITSGALKTIKDAELETHRDNIQLIIDALNGTKEDPGLASSKSLLSKNGTPLANWSKQAPGPISVTVPIINKYGTIEYTSYQMEKGVFSKLDSPIKVNPVVDTKFKQAIESAKEGTKVVKMIYKGEPLIVSLNISHPNNSYEKARLNMQNTLDKEALTFVPPVTNNNGIEKPGRVENKTLSSLSMNQLESAKEKVQKDIKFVNTNTKVAPQNKDALKVAIRESRMMPIETAIEMKRRQAPAKGGFTAKKSKKNNKTKKSTRRSS